jgi:hypothetical protein
VRGDNLQISLEMQEDFFKKESKALKNRVASKRLQI